MFIEEKASGEPSIQGFLDFTKGKPADEIYNWSNSDRCACAQYSQSLGKFEEWHARSNSNATSFWEYLNLLAREGVTFQGIGGQMTGTFGGLRSVLERKVLEDA